MSTFWMTAQTAAARYGSDWRAFSLFGPVHLFWLGLALALCIGLGLWYRRAAPRARRRMLVVLTILLLADECFKYVVTLATGQWNWSFLPLHLCSLNIFVCAANTVRPSAWLQEILYALCPPGALVALLSPSWQALPLCNAIHLHSSTIHIMLVLYPVLLLAGGFRPNPRRLPFVCGCLAAAAVPVFGINRLLGTNFMFLNGSDGNAITRLMAGVLGERFYILGFLPVIALLWAVLYLPWVLANRRAAAPRPKTHV